MAALSPPLRRRFFCTQAIPKAYGNHRSWTVKQVRKSNFSDSLVEEIKSQVSASDFVAVSLQKTGSFSSPWHRPSPFDTPEIAYLKAKYAADRFQVFQLAICPFRIRAPTVTAYPYNFHLFPRDEMKVGIPPSYSFSCQSSSLVAMARDGFDFNACINDGISYLSREQESAVKARTDTPRVVDDLGESASPLSVADSIFVERVKSRVKNWKNAVHETASNTKEENLVKVLRRLIVENEKFESRPCMNIDVCSDRQAHLVIKMLQNYDDDLVPLMVPAKSGGSQAVRVVLTISKEDRDLLLERLENIDEEANKKIRGFREVIDLISASQKPIVSHNSLNDLTFIHSKFLAPLPPSMDEFMASLHMVFPHVIDVNHLVKEIGLRKNVASVPYIISYLKHRFSQPVDVEIPFQVEEGEIHGHNVVSISELFAKLCCILKLTPGTGEHHVENRCSSLGAFVNNFHPRVTELQEPTDGEVRVWTSSNTKQVRCEDLVFLWGFRTGTTAGKLKTLLEGSHEVFSQGFHVRLVDQSCAIVVFSRPSSSTAFLNAMSNLSDTSSNSLRELASEGITATGYETYERACRSGLWEANLADSLDKAMADIDYSLGSGSDERMKSEKSCQKSFARSSYRMAVGVIESSLWLPNVSLFGFIFVCCFFSISLLPQASKANRSLGPLDNGASSAFLSFQRKFLLMYSLASVMEGLWAVFGEYELAFHGVTKEQMVTSLCVGYGASLIVGTFLGMVSDSIGHKKACLIFCFLHLFVGLWKKISPHPSLWIASICLSLSTSIYSFSFEAWLVVENEKQGYRQDTLSDTFWLMTFFESVSLIVSQVLVNWLLGSNLANGLVSPSSAAIILSVVSFICVSNGWKETPQTAVTKDYNVSYAHIFKDKQILLLGFAHACLQFSIAVFWLLWAPTLVADGREVHLGLVYPCLLGARMLGSTIFPWLLTGPSSLRTEDCLLYAFVVLGISLSVVAYDYQEIAVLVSLFCLFHAVAGLITPSLARLRTMHVPNELRGGMIALSLAPSHAAVLYLLVQRGYYQRFENSTMLSLASIGLFVSAGCMHLLKQWGKQPYQNWHKM
ncbi:Poly(A)-specific ribonuclease PARN-like [Linum perenne]